MAQQHDYLTATAEGLGVTLGHIAGRVDAWKRDRRALAREIHAVVKAAHAMLHEIGAHPAASAEARKGGRPKGYTMSEASKAKLRDAWKRRKGEMAHDVTVASKTATTMSAAARARISAAQKLRWAAIKRG